MPTAWVTSGAGERPLGGERVLPVDVVGGQVLVGVSAVGAQPLVFVGAAGAVERFCVEGGAGGNDTAGDQGASCVATSGRVMWAAALVSIRYWAISATRRPAARALPAWPARLLRAT